MGAPAMIHFRSAKDLREIPVCYMSQEEAEQVLQVDRIRQVLIFYGAPVLIIQDYLGDGETRVYVHRSWVASMLPYLRKGE